MDRITASPQTGQGDLGMSQLVADRRLRKSSPICSFQNHLEWLKNDLSHYLCQYGLSNEKDVFIFQTLTRSIIGNIGSSVYFKLQNQDFAISQAFFTQIESRIEYLAQEMPKARDFIIYESPQLIKLDDSRIKVREVEHLFWVVIESIYFDDDLPANYQSNPVVTSTASFLNAFSDYLWLLTRYEGKQLGLKETYWEHQ